jgi:hypothetical protein
VHRDTIRKWKSGSRTPDANALRKLRAVARRQAAATGVADPASTRAREGHLTPPPPPAPSAARAPADESAPEPARPQGLYALPARAGAPAPTPTRPPRQPDAVGIPSGADFPRWLAQLGRGAAAVKPLAEAEAARLRTSVIRSLTAFWAYADEGITYTNRQRAEAQIWRRVDAEETALLADWLIEHGKRSAMVAQMVRGVSRVWDYYAVGLILGPRLVETWRFYAAHGGFSL